MAKSKKTKKGLSYHIKLYIFLVVVGLLAFGITTAIINSAKTFSCANSKTCSSDLLPNIENNVPGTFEGKKVIPPTIDVQQEKITPVLGITTPVGEKHIYVDLAAQTLVAYQGTQQIFKTLVSTGKWGITPTGNFHIWEKLIATRMAGGEGADAYDLPNVPYVMYFYHDFGLHGAYWHDNFGHPMSHGCVNMRQVDAKTVFDWADGPNGATLGTAVSICDQISKDNVCIQKNPVQ